MPVSAPALSSVSPLPPAPSGGAPADGSAARRFFSGAGLPLFIASATLVYEVFLLAVVFAPETTGVWGAFARDFKRWCFDYDPRTGGMSWAAAGVMLVEPLFIALTTALLWRRSLSQSGQWRRHWRALAGGAGAAALAVGGLFLYGRADASADDVPPFPGERIRVRLTLPDLAFSDQRGQPFRLDAERGRVVLVTGVYTLCSTACPEILREVRTLLDGLPDDVRTRVSVAAISLNPEYDTADLMTQVTEAYGFRHPEFRFLNGPPAEVHEALSRLGFSRSVNPVTRTIDHANLFLLVDAEGHIAYRFTLDARLRSWLREALLGLAAEAEARP